MADLEGPIRQPDATADVASAFAEMARAVFSSGSVEQTLSQVVGLAVTTIEGCDFASIFVREGGEGRTQVCSDPVVAEVDAAQRGAGEGPCLDAASHGQAFYAADLLDDRRWPRFGPEAAARGMRSLLALPLAADGTVGALNLYARYPDAFGVIDRARGLLLAVVAGLAVSAAQAQEEEERRMANLHAALASREIIGQAQGILMERERITADQAFDILRRASQHLNLKLREIAQNLVDTGERPNTGPTRST